MIALVVIAWLEVSLLGGLLIARFMRSTMKEAAND